MKLRDTLLILLSTAMLFLIACDSLTKQFGVVTADQMNDARNRFDGAYRSLPRIADAVLIKKVEISGDGQTEGCATIGIAELDGTNQLSFTEVIEFYTRALEARGWRIHSTSNDGRTLDTDDFALGLSDFYDIVDQDAANQARNKFKTLYVLEFNMAVVQPLPSRCRDT